MRKTKIASVGCGWVARRWHLPTPVTLPITETTVYEQMIHDEFHQKFGHAIDE